jgi:CelD/BcsL family acetyltransferase involved in cellulose biosynthesis
LELKLYVDPADFAELRSEWNDLLRRSRFDTLFLTWEWQTHWWACLGSERGPLFVLTARTDDRLVGILPLYRMPGSLGQTLHVVGCIEVSDYLDLIVETGHEQAVYAAFLDWLAGPDAPDWDAVDLCNQPAYSLAHSLLPESARARGWRVDVSQEDVCPIVPLPGDWDAYLESLDKKQRHEIKRKLRRIEREAPAYRLRCVDQGPEVTAAMRAFIQLHRLSRSDKNAFMTPGMEAFFHDIALMAAEASWLRLAFLDIDDHPVAGYFCFNYGSDLLIYNSGYDPQAYPQLSPGWVLLAGLIRTAISEGRTRVDFLQGNEDYKYRFGGVNTPVYRTILQR